MTGRDVTVPRSTRLLVAVALLLATLPAARDVRSEIGGLDVAAIDVYLIKVGDALGAAG